MHLTTALPNAKSQNKIILHASLIFVAALVFSAAFAWINNVNYTWLSPHFERSSTPTGWGIIQRLYLIIPAAAAAVWRPRQIGFQIGKIFLYRRMLLIMLAANVLIVGGYLILSGATPYSGTSMLFNEVITVPLVEEIVWRGIIFAVLAAALRRCLPETTSGTLAAIFSGICFGLLHATNALYGYPLAFVAIQTLNATVWGIMYGIARAKTESIYPSILLHAAMNLVAALA